MPYEYTYGDYVFTSDDEYDDEQLASLVQMIENPRSKFRSSPSISAEFQQKVPRRPSWMAGPAEGPIADILNRERTKIPKPPNVAGPLDMVITAGLRTAPPVLGSIGGGILGGGPASPPTAAIGAAIGGAAGGGLGETLAEWYEKSQDLRKEFNPAMIGLESAFGAIPGSKAIKPLPRIALNALSGAGQAGIGEAARIYTEEHRMPGLTDVVIPMSVGAVASGGLGEVGHSINQRAAKNVENRNWATARIKEGENELVNEEVNAIRQQMMDHADEAVEAANNKRKENWINVQLAKRKETGKTIKQIREEAQDLESLNRPAQETVKTFAMRRYAQEMGLDWEDLDNSLLKYAREKYGVDAPTTTAAKPPMEVGPPPETGRLVPKGTSPGQVTPPGQMPKITDEVLKAAREEGPEGTERIMREAGAPQEQIDELMMKAFAPKPAAPSAAGTPPAIPKPPATPNPVEIPPTANVSQTEILQQKLDDYLQRDWNTLTPDEQKEAIEVFDYFQNQESRSESIRKNVGGGWYAEGVKKSTPRKMSPYERNQMALQQQTARQAAQDTAELAARVTQSTNPVVRDIVENHPGQIVDLSKRIPTAQTIWNKYVTSRLRKLEQLQGHELVTRIQTFEREIPQMVSDLGGRVDDVFEGLGKGEIATKRWENILARRLNPSIEPLDDAARIGYEKMRQIDLYKAQLHAQANLGEFKPNPKPMSYDVGFWGNTDAVQDALIKRFPGLSRQSARWIVNGAKYLDDAAEAKLEKEIATAGGDRGFALENYRQQNIKSSGKAPEHQLMVDLDLPGYKSGIEAVKQDNYNFSEKVARTLVEDDDMMDRLYNQTLNPKLAKELTKQVVGFRNYKPSQQAVSKVNQLVGRYATMRMLGSYIVSNLPNIQGSFIEAGVGRTLKHAMNLMTSSAARKEAGQIAKEAGTNVDLSRGMLQELQTRDVFGTIVKYGWTKQVEIAENMMRTLNAAVGREYAQSLFGKLKAGDITVNEQSKLLRYTLAKNIDELMNQPELTEKQLKYAAYGFTERTQGTRSGLNVSQEVDSEHELIRTMMMFKRYAAQSTKLIKDSMFGEGLTNTERLRNGMRWALGAQAMGEITGDIKAAIKGGTMDVSDEFFNEQDKVNHTKKEVMERGEWLNYIFKGWLGEKEIPPLAARVIDNAIQGWMFGLVSDMALAGVGGAEELTSTALGPVGSDVIQGFSGLTGIGQNLLHDKETIVPNRFTRQAVRMIPVVGPGVAASIAPTQRESGRNVPASEYFSRGLPRKVAAPVRRTIKGVTG